LNGAKLGKVALQLLVVCAIAQATDKYFPAREGIKNRFEMTNEKAEKMGHQAVSDL
jgi:hypothetical protein